MEPVLTSPTSSTPPKIAAVIVAAGRGRRAGTSRPKQFIALAGKPVLAHTVLAFQQAAGIARIVVVLHPDDLALYEIEVAPHLHTPSITICLGADSRDKSVKNGLEALVKYNISTVLIHDGARPFPSKDLIADVIENTQKFGAAAPALPVSDSLWRGKDGLVAGDIARAGIFRAQTPQGFSYPAILAAHRASNGPATDDVEIARRANMRVAIVDGERQNIKITTPDDFARAARLIAQQTGVSMDIRTGNGFDVHAFCAGDHVTLCGVKIPYERALRGHSDADVAMHAVSDAIYGALAQGDIGQWFPPTDPRWKGAASDIFLRHSIALCKDEGFVITNADCTIICESPKIGPHAETMRERMAEIMEIAKSRISVKATTTEKLGLTGRKEGIAALATVTLLKTGAI